MQSSSFQWAHLYNDVWLREFSDNIMVTVAASRKKLICMPFLENWRKMIHCVFTITWKDRPCCPIKWSRLEPHLTIQAVLFFPCRTQLPQAKTNLPAPADKVTNAKAMALKRSISCQIERVNNKRARGWTLHWESQLPEFYVRQLQSRGTAGYHVILSSVVFCITTSPPHGTLCETFYTPVKRFS